MSDYTFVSFTVFCLVIHYANVDWYYGERACALVFLVGKDRPWDLRLLIRDVAII